MGVCMCVVAYVQRCGRSLIVHRGMRRTGLRIALPLAWQGQWLAYLLSIRSLTLDITHASRVVASWPRRHIFVCTVYAWCFAQERL